MLFQVILKLRAHTHRASALTLELTLERVRLVSIARFTPSIGVMLNTSVKIQKGSGFIQRSAGLGTEVTKKFQTWNDSWPYMLKSAIIPVMMLGRWLYPQIIRCHLWITNTEEPGHVCDKVKACVPQTQSPLYFPVVSTNQILRYVAPAQCPNKHNAICIVKITLYS